MENRKQIALRFDPNLLKRMDDIRQYTHHPTRTELIETACIAYVSYLKYCIEEEILE